MGGCKINLSPKTSNDLTMVVKSSKYTALKADYESMFAAAVIRPKWIAEATNMANRIAKNKSRYEIPAAKLGVPWFVLGLIHVRESGANFGKHMHNGDPLTARTTRVPAGQPATGNPPFSWEDSAFDAINTKNKTSWKQIPSNEWGIAAILWRLATYNGWGYEPYGRANPYLWSGTQWYGDPPLIGKFIRDNVYSATAIDGQVGVATVTKRAVELGYIDGKSFGSGSGLTNIQDGGLGCIDGGAGGNRTFSAQNPQSVFEAIQVALGLDARARAQDRNVELRLNGLDPKVLELNPQTTFEMKGVQKDLVGTYTVDEVVFTCGGSLDVKVIAYSPDPNAPPPSVFTSGNAGGGGGTPAGGAPPAGSINERIFKAAQESRGLSTRSGPGGGNVACAWVINRFVLKKAGINIIGSNPDYVTSVEEALIAGRGKEVSIAEAQPGDVVIMGRNRKAHIGIYMGNGKTLSNSSSKAAFAWEDSWESYNRRYGPPNCKPYRVLS
jgi:lysozyme family protein